MINPPWQFDVFATQILQYLANVLKPEDAPVMPLDDMAVVKWLVGE